MGHAAHKCDGKTRSAFVPNDSARRVPCARVTPPQGGAKSHLGQRKGVPDELGAVPDEHLHELRPGQLEESAVGLGGDGTGDEGLPHSGGSVQEAPLGRLDPQLLELVRVRDGQRDGLLQLLRCGEGRRVWVRVRPRSHDGERDGLHHNALPSLAACPPATMAPTCMHNHTNHTTTHPANHPQSTHLDLLVEPPHVDERLLGLLVHLHGLHPRVILGGQLVEHQVRVLVHAHQVAGLQVLLARDRG